MVIMKALIVVDVQNDFCEGGKLAVQGGKKAASDIAAMLSDHNYAFVVATKDSHDRNNDNDGHFGNPPDFIDSWPVHCLSRCWGSNFRKPIRSDMFSDIFKKGRGIPAYSGFEGVGNYSKLTLHEYLRGQGVRDVDICGIAYDYCVKETAISAAELDYNVRVLRDLCPSIGPKHETDFILEDEGIEIA